MTAAQTQHQREASSNRTMLASVNHGRPDVAASSRPEALNNRSAETRNRSAATERPRTSNLPAARPAPPRPALLSVLRREPKSLLLMSLHPSRHELLRNRFVSQSPSPGEPRSRPMSLRLNQLRPRNQPLMSPLPNQLEPRNRLTSLRPSQLRPRSQLLMSPLPSLRMRRRRVLHTRLLMDLNCINKPIQPTIRSPDGTRRGLRWGK